jgi:rhodanese-related sulfurtransferase
MNIKTIFVIFFLASLISCSKAVQEQETSSSKVNETELLYSLIEKTGDIANSKQAPFTIGADEVFEELSSLLVIDIRDTADYYAGHIEGAIWVGAKELPGYLDLNVRASNYEKIVIACYSGQSSAYYATLLRLAGYSNIYTLRFGMSGWSKKLAPNRIIDNLTDKYAGMLEKTTNTPEKKYELPTISTGSEGPYSIMLSRVKTLFEEGFGPAHIKIDSVVQNLDKYFIVNYWPIEDYQKGHLPGAYQFTPRESLMKDKMLAYLPTDKPIAIYCNNGQMSASAAAFLRVLGYDAISISFGCNGFMYNYLKSWQKNAFNPKENIFDFPYFVGKTPGPEHKTTSQSKTNDEGTKNLPVVPVKKKQKTGGGGC